MVKPIQTNIFLDFIESLNGKILTTRSRKKPFQVNVSDNRLEFVPQSTGKVRKISDKNFTEVINHFNKTRLFQPKDYLAITRNSVYILTLIESYLENEV